MKAVGVEYRVLGYASSELEIEAKPFLVVISMHDRMCGFVLANWKTAVGCDNTFGALYIGDMLQDIADQTDGLEEEQHTLFSSLAELSVGPLRTIKAGIFTGNLPTIGTNSSNSECVVECKESFLALLIGALAGE